MPSIVEPPDPASITATRESRSTPASLATTSASATVRAFAAATELLISLIVWPCPSGPTWSTSRPTASNTDRPRAKSLSRPAGHDRQRRVRGTGRRSGDRGVDEPDSVGLEPPPIRPVAAGPIVEQSMQRRPGAAARGDTAGPEQDRLDLVAVDDHRDDDVASARQGGRRVGDPGRVAHPAAKRSAVAASGSRPSAGSRPTRCWPPSASP